MSTESSDPGPAKSEAGATKSADVGAMRSDLNSTAEACGKLWLTYLFFVFYLTVSVAAVTHLDLFLEQPVKMPVLNVELPLVAFFCLAPVFLLTMHAYVLVNFVALSNKAAQMRDRLAAEARDRPDSAERHEDARKLLTGNVFVQYLAGPAELRGNAFGRVLLAIAWCSLVFAPLFLLLLVQMQFLPYQNTLVTWLHRYALFADVALLWWLWGAIVSSQDAPASAGSRLRRSAAVLASVALILFSFVVAGGDDERQADDFRLRGLQNALFRSALDEDSGRPRLPFSNRLALANANIAELAAAHNASTSGKTAHVLRARKRSLRGAVFDHAILTNADFTGADLQGASFYYSQLDNSVFDMAAMEGASFRQSTARGGSFEDARLFGAIFRSANLAGADFVRAKLAKAMFEDAGLRGAEFYQARLHKASLKHATIFGSSFQAADLSCAHFETADISASDFSKAQLDPAALAKATVFAVDFTEASLAAAPAQADCDDAGLREGRAGAELAKASSPGADPLHALQTDLFVDKLCEANADNPYVLKGVVFRSLTGRKAIEAIDRLLSLSCVTSQTFSAEDLVKLLSHRVTLVKSDRPAPEQTAERASALR